MKLKGAREMFNKLLELKNRGRILGVDVGEKYIGVALSDKNYRQASPLRVLCREEHGGKKKDVSEEVSYLVKHYSLSGIVVGWPTHHGKPTTGSFHVQSFISELSKNDKLSEIYYAKWDEAYTSKVVALLIEDLKFPPEVDEAIRDKFAAVAILQEYLDDMNVDVKGIPIPRVDDMDLNKEGKPIPHVDDENVDKKGEPLPRD